jgi:hypothetical protein
MICFHWYWLLLIPAVFVVGFITIPIILMVKMPWGP